MCIIRETIRLLASQVACEGGWSSARRAHALELIHGGAFFRALDFLQHCVKGVRAAEALFVEPWEVQGGMPSRSDQLAIRVELRSTFRVVGPC